MKTNQLQKECWYQRSDPFQFELLNYATSDDIFRAQALLQKKERQKKNTNEFRIKILFNIQIPPIWEKIGLIKNTLFEKPQMIYFYLLPLSVFAFKETTGKSSDSVQISSSICPKWTRFRNLSKIYLFIILFLEFFRYSFKIGPELVRNLSQNRSKSASRLFLDSSKPINNLMTIIIWITITEKYIKFEK